MQTRYELTPMTAIRANYSRGMSPANPYDLVPYILDNGEGNIPRYSIGNPSEKATTANNYDLLLQQELRPFGIIQTGYFYKQLCNPIVQVDASCEITGSLCNIPGQTINTDDGLPNLAQQDINISNAQVWGLEFAWRQNMTYLPGALRGMQMMANYTYADSHSNGIPGSTSLPHWSRTPQASEFPVRRAPTATAYFSL